MKGIPVLMYHALEDSVLSRASMDPAGRLYLLHADVFRDHMARLKDDGFRGVLLKDLSSKKCLPQKPLVITFDDGHVSDYEIALPILDSFSFRAEFFITTRWIGGPGYLDASQIRALAAAGMGIGAHGATHTFLDDLSPAAAKTEMVESRESLEAILGAPINALSFPGGRRPNERLISESGYAWGCDSRPGFFFGDSTLRVPRFAIRRDTNMAQLAGIIHGENRYVWSLILAAFIRGCAKRLLGNRNYAWLHRIAAKRG
jgi:peptidoglycan/xylan/chitin deacetylase (PgdA/CDA1 family)